jgi:translation initiation factor eIF-2B subunit beta
MEKLQ